MRIWGLKCDIFIFKLRLFMLDLLFLLYSEFIEPKVMLRSFTFDILSNKSHCFGITTDLWLRFLNKSYVYNSVRVCPLCETCSLYEPVTPKVISLWQTGHILCVLNQNLSRCHHSLLRDGKQFIERAACQPEGFNLNPSRAWKMGSEETEISGLRCADLTCISIHWFVSQQLRWKSKSSQFFLKIDVSGYNNVCFH